MTAWRLVTIFPKILANSLGDILHLPKQSVSIVLFLFFFSSVNDNVKFFDKKLEQRKTIV